MKNDANVFFFKTGEFLPIRKVVAQLFLLCLAYWFTGCTTNRRPSTTSNIYTFIDSVSASKKIVQDDMEGYFNRLSRSDMSIQMKIPLKDTILVNRKSFEAFLAKEVSSWTTHEKQTLKKTLDKAIMLVKKLNPDCLKPFSLVKIKTNHFGRDVYYTRGSTIYIPENIFENYSDEQQLPILIHEIFHIISKFNEPYRIQLYALIGFEKLNTEPVLPQVLADRLLTNPDGVSCQYAINLSDPESQVKKLLAIPLITSPPGGYQSEKPNFFDYLSFDLFEIKDEKDSWQVLADQAGKTTLALASTPRFFTQIKDNTQYIIHPEEIMADNFMLAVLAMSENNYSRFSPEGKKLINKVISITKGYSFQ